MHKRLVAWCLASYVAQGGWLSPFLLALYMSSGVMGPGVASGLLPSVGWYT